MPASETARTVVSTNKPAVQVIEQAASIQPPRTTTMAKQVFERFDACEVTDDMISEAARLFNEYYGTWGKNTFGSGLRPAKSVSPVLLDSLMKGRQSGKVKPEPPSSRLSA